jgi:hypothetical protein
MDPDMKWEGDGTVVLQALIKTLVRFVYKSLA